MSNPLAILTFRLGDQAYAFTIDQVVEVAAMMTVTQLANVPPQILGLINRHGMPIPLIDLRLVFERPAAPLDAATLFIVVQAQGKLLAMVVDEVDQVENIALDQVQPGPSPYVSGIVTEKNRLIQLVALHAVMSKLEGNYGQRTA